VGVGGVNVDAEYGGILARYGLCEGGEGSGYFGHAGHPDHPGGPSPSNTGVAADDAPIAPTQRPASTPASLMDWADIPATCGGRRIK
jgi:hypothetical protein